MWDITNRCNQRCKHCYNIDFNNRPDMSDIKITPEVVKKINHFIRKYKVSHLAILGGEPLIRKDLFEVINDLSQDVIISITTNATLLSHEIVEKIKLSPIAKIGISLESALPERYNQHRGGDYFNSFINGVRLLSELHNLYGERIHKDFAVTVLPNMLIDEKDVIRIYKLAIDNDINGIAFQFPIAAGGGAKLELQPEYILRIAESIARVSIAHPHITTFMQHRQILIDYCNRKYGSTLLGGKKNCPAGTGIIVVDNRLKAYPCVFHNGSSELLSKIDMCFGFDISQYENDILKDTNNLLKGKLMVTFRAMRDQIAAAIHDDVCNGCRYRSDCYKICPFEYILSHDDAFKSHADLCKRIISNDGVSK